MKIGLLITSIGSFGQKGFYNTQELGLAKALDQYFDEVQIYKLVSKKEREIREQIEECKNVILNLIPAKSLGINGHLDTRILDISLDVLVYFSDTQLSVPKVFQWAKKNGVQFYPYIGVLESHSTSVAKRLLINTLFRRNLAVYQKCHCLVKTTAVEKQLKDMGVQDITVMPVGLDLTLLHQDYLNVNANELKVKYGFTLEDRVILFIGRLIDEKQPIRMIDNFAELFEKDKRYKLLMVGTGPLKDAVENRIVALGLQDKIMRIDRIANSDIWELYRFADCFVNLNRREIFGMAILEAMYYNCKIIAWNAPGPELIIKDGISGFLVNGDEMFREKIMNPDYHPENGREWVVNNFTWDNMANYISALVKNKGKNI